MTSYERLLFEKALDRLVSDVAHLVDRLELFSAQHELACKAADAHTLLYEIRRGFCAQRQPILRTRPPQARSVA